MSQETAAKKDTQRLQRAIVEGLEDVKAQDIQVFNTEHLSPLFERVIVATGSSNRQTRALAASVRDAVRDAGFGKPRIEGEENGEWIIVDCGPAVAHIMQPTIRTYYHLEEIWGDKPVRLKLGAPKPATAAAPVAAPAKKSARKTDDDAPMLRRSSAARSAQKAADAEAKKAKEQKTPARKTPAGRTAAGKSAPGKTATGGAARTSAKPPVKSAAAKPATARKAAPAKAAPAKKAPARKSAPRKPAPKSGA